MNKFLLILLSIITPIISKAENAVEMADLMHENGKIYVVVGVLSIIFIGIVVYMIMIDKKVTKLEKQLNSDT